MSILKLMRTTIEPQDRSRRIAERRKLLANHWSEPPSKWVEELARWESELATVGDSTRVRVFGLPLPKADSAVRRRGVSWAVDDADFTASTKAPILLPLLPKQASEYGFDVQRHGIWLYQGRVYLSDGGALTPEDVMALVNQEANKRRLALAKAHALEAMTAQLDRPRQREKLSQEVRLEVWQRDGGRCSECGSQADLEFDHIIPFAMGGSNTARNLQLLCGDCNRRKGMTLG